MHLLKDTLPTEKEVMERTHVTMLRKRRCRDASLFA